MVLPAQKGISLSEGFYAVKKRAGDVRLPRPLAGMAAQPPSHPRPRGVPPTSLTLS